jgi:MoxR-like ATPase
VLEFTDTLFPPGLTHNPSEQSRINLRFKSTGLVGLIGSDSFSQDLLPRAISGEITPLEGTITWNGASIEAGSGKSSHWCAHAVLADTDTPQSVSEVVRSKIRDLSSNSSRTTANLESAAESLLEECALQGLKTASANSLSIRQKARLAVALALASSPAILVCTGFSAHPALCDDKDLAALLSLIALKGRLVFTSGISSETLHLLDSIVVLHEGFVAFHSAPQHLAHYTGITDLSALSSRLSARRGSDWCRSWSKHRQHFYKILHPDTASLPTEAADSIRSDCEAREGLPENDGERAAFLLNAFNGLRREMAKLIVGQEEVIEQLLIAILSGGHCLLEGVPGLAKTAIVRSLSHAMQLSFRRIQFTPDLMPADITGTDIIQEDSVSGTRKFVFQRGPIFTQMLLADEINRTPAKTQAALLEAMQEHSVTASGHSLHLDQPFFVLATQNPIEQEGTYPLPEAQKDRFLFHIHVGYPEREQERLVIERTTSDYQAQIQPVINGPQILECQKTARKVPVPDHVMNFVLDLVRNTRPDADQSPKFVKELISWGAGPRACQCLVLAGKVRALLKGRFSVSLEDIEVLAKPVLRHRIVPTFNAESEGITADAIIEKLLAATPRSHSQAPL